LQKWKVISSNHFRLSSKERCKIQFLSSLRRMKRSWLIKSERLQQAWNLSPSYSKTKMICSTTRTRLRKSRKESSSLTRISVEVSTSSFRRKPQFWLFWTTTSKSTCKMLSKWQAEEIARKETLLLFWC
jgi:hypothetical protein